MYRQAKQFWDKESKSNMAELGSAPCPSESVELLKDTIECDDDQSIPHVFVVMGASVCTQNEILKVTMHVKLCHRNNLI